MFSGMVKPESSGIGKSNVEPLKSNVTLLKSEGKFNMPSVPVKLGQVAEEARVLL